MKHILFLTTFVMLGINAHSQVDLDSLFQKNLTKNLETAKTNKKNGLANNSIGFYKKHISPIYLSNCAFSPSCSQFAKESFDQNNLIKAFFLSADRLTRCHPKAWKYQYDYDYKHNLCIDHP